ncbi:hypothetical protein [Amphritea sp.]|uniref:hypothetical protein n=1 Tax=Amphritea sp. TaxID=1872502 RepID=UPI003D1391EE
MDGELKVPPKEKSFLTPPRELAEKLNVLVGQRFELTGKSRTDGSNLRKLVASTLLANSAPDGASRNTFEVIPPKGVPKILLEYVDTYIATSGRSYNLQVWNRNPSSESVQVEYTSGETLQSGEVRFVLVKVSPLTSLITAVAVLTPDYVVNKFGVFGKPTVKHQLIISSSARRSVLANPENIFFYDDPVSVGCSSNISNLSKYSIHDKPTKDSLLPLSTIKDIIQDQIIGLTIESAATKSRGQMLEGIFAKALGYNVQDGELLAGGYPDIRNQALEVKIQDSATVDLGMYSPEFEVAVPGCDGFTTRNMRYFIALTNSDTNLVVGGILCSGSKLGLHFTYVSDKSYKCQRSIPMAFFDDIYGRSVFNP